MLNSFLAAIVLSLTQLLGIILRKRLEHFFLVPTVVFSLKVRLRIKFRITTEGKKKALQVIFLNSILDYTDPPQSKQNVLYLRITKELDFFSLQFQITKIVLSKKSLKLVKRQYQINLPLKI